MQHEKFKSTHVTYAPKPKPLRNNENFAQQKITFEDSPLFFPAGMEKFFLLIYFIVLPYIAGLIFLFFYVAEGKTELFFSLSEESSFMLTWAVGYEIIATLLLINIVKMAISFSIENAKKGARKNFQRP